MYIRFKDGMVDFADDGGAVVDTRDVVDFLVDGGCRELAPLDTYLHSVLLLLFLLHNKWLSQLGF